MYVHVNENKLAEMLPLFLIILFALAAVLYIVFIFLKKSDDKKPLNKKKVKVVEKLSQQGKIAWYIVECENGERLQLRTFQADTIMLTVGDKGMLAYRGKTIQSFDRE